MGALLTMLLLANLTHGRFGRAMRAVREDEVGARLAGIDVARTKVLAFVVSAATAGLGGALIAVETQAVSPGAYGLELSLFLVVAVVVGGLGHLGWRGLGGAARWWHSPSSPTPWPTTSRCRRHWPSGCRATSRCSCSAWCWSSYRS